MKVETISNKVKFNLYSLLSFPINEYSLSESLGDAVNVIHKHISKNDTKEQYEKLIKEFNLDDHLQFAYGTSSSRLFANDNIEKFIYAYHGKYNTGKYRVKDFLDNLTTKNVIYMFNINGNFKLCTLDLTDISTYNTVKQFQEFVKFSVLDIKGYVDINNIFKDPKVRTRKLVDKLQLFKNAPLKVFVLSDSEERSQTVKFNDLSKSSYMRVKNAGDSVSRESHYANSITNVLNGKEEISYDDLDYYSHIKSSAEKMKSYLIKKGINNLSDYVCIQYTTDNLKKVGLDTIREVIDRKYTLNSGTLKDLKFNRNKVTPVDMIVFNSNHIEKIVDEMKNIDSPETRINVFDKLMQSKLLYLVSLKSTKGKNISANVIDNKPNISIDKQELSNSIKSIIQEYYGRNSSVKDYLSSIGVLIPFTEKTEDGKIYRRGKIQLRSKGVGLTDFVFNIIDVTYYDTENGKVLNTTKIVDGGTNSKSTINHMLSMLDVEKTDYLYDLITKNKTIYDLFHSQMNNLSSVDILDSFKGSLNNVSMIKLYNFLKNIDNGITNKDFKPSNIIKLFIYQYYMAKSGNYDDIVYIKKVEQIDKLFNKIPNVVKFKIFREVIEGLLDSSSNIKSSSIKYLILKTVSMNLIVLLNNWVMSSEGQDKLHNALDTYTKIASSNIKGLSLPLVKLF